MTTFRLARALAPLATLLAIGAAACGGGTPPETAPAPAPEPAPAVVAAAAPAPTVCAPNGLLTDNMRTRFGDMFSARDSISVRRRAGMKIARLANAPVSTVSDDRVCERAVRSLATREPAAASALGEAPPARGRAGAARPVRPVRAASGGVLALVKVGPYFLVQDAAPRPNESASPTYVLDASMRLKGVIQ